MVARQASRTSSCNAGELDPLLAGRPDVKQYYSGGLKFKNVEPVPQSGFRLMPGSMDGGVVRGRLGSLEGVNYDGAQGDIVWQGGFAPQKLAVAEVIDIATGVPGQVQWEVLVDGVWCAFGAAFFIDGFGRNRSVGVAPGQAKLIGAARLRRIDGVGSVNMGGVSLFKEEAEQDRPRYCALRMEQGLSYLFSFQAGFCDIWRGKKWVAILRMAPLQQMYLPDIDFYAEGATVGIFHEDLESLRIRRAGTDAEWVLDKWPYEAMPEVDYGGAYPKTNDIWKVMLRAIDAGQWAAHGGFGLDLTVNGERARTVRWGGDWGAFAHQVKLALEDLPSLRPGIGVGTFGHAGDAVELTIEFGGQNSGREYQFSCLVGNTANVSALPSHTQIGKTGGEALLSNARGWPGTCALMQDRLAYARIKGQPAAQLLSEVGEYFRVNIKATADSAARLDRLRSQTGEKILRVKESKYFMAFTNEGVYFASNRVISRNEPLNYINASEIGIRPNTTPVDMEGLLYYVSNNGNQVLSLVYDDVSTVYNARVETLLSSHLVERIIRNVRQVGMQSTDASRLWLLREDGRLICANVIRDQEIMGLCEWVAADGGKIREIIVDGDNDVWACVERGGRLRHEYMKEGQWLQQAVETTTDEAGCSSGLEFEDGAQIWAVASGHVMGPYSCEGGKITLDKAWQHVTIGRWIAPLYQSMPHVLITDDDKIIRRPGRIHTVQIHILATTSLAVGANGSRLSEVALLEAGDKQDAPLAPKSKPLIVAGLMGRQVDTTLVISQLRPGALQVRDYSCSEKL